MIKKLVVTGLAALMALSFSLTAEAHHGYGYQANAQVCGISGCAMGTCFMDADGDGLCYGHNFVDANGDGICDNHFYYDGNGDAVCDYFVDANGDGICDHCHNHGKPVVTQRPARRAYYGSYRRGHHGCW